MQEFIEACQKIESDKNYQPYITNSGLLNLIANEDGSPKHIPRKSTIVFQNSKITPTTEKGEFLGKVYQLKIASKSCTDWSDDISVWNIDDSVVILINRIGEFSFHSRENAENNDFKLPLQHLSIDSFLNKESLAEAERKKQTVEIKKNAYLLSQGQRSENSFFAQLPDELLVKIAALTGDKEIIPVNEANEIAHNTFGRPKF